MVLLIMYREEAARMWRMREAEWEREARARQKLMAQVLWSILVCAVHHS